MKCESCKFFEGFREVETDFDTGDRMTIAKCLIRDVANKNGCSRFSEKEANNG